MIKKDTGKRQRRTKILLSVAIVLLTASMGFGVIVSNMGDSQTLEYNDIKFKQTQIGQFSTTINDQQYSFDYFPTYVEKIDMDPYATQLLEDASQIIYTSDENSSAAQYIGLAQFSLDQLFSKQNKPTFTGFTAPNTKNIPVATCADATAQRPVIYFLLSNQTIVSTQGNCVIVAAVSSQDLLAAKDRIVYSYLGILP